MPEIDTGRSRAAARALRSSSDNLREAVAGELRLSDASGALAGSATVEVVHDLQSTIALRVFDAVTEFGAVASGIDLLVDNVSSATGGAGHE